MSGSNKLHAVMLRTFLLITCTFIYAGAISGLPEKNTPDATVTIIRVNNVTSLRLSCRCSLHSPMWSVMRLEDWQTEQVSGPIGCEENGGDCTPKARSFIAQQSDGLFTYIDHTFTINQTTVLKCYKVPGSADTPDETAIIYFNRDGKLTSRPSALYYTLTN